MDRFSNLSLKIEVGLQDFFIVLIYLVIIISFFLVVKKFQVKNSRISKYYIPGLVLKLFGSLAFALIYTFYYRYGDTFIYFDGIKVLTELLYTKPNIWFKIIFLNAGEFTPETYPYTSQIVFFRENSVFTIIKIGSIINLFAFNNYFALSLLFATFSFICVWLLYTTFNVIAPYLYKYSATSIFFIPSIFFWSSGIIKDTIAFSLLSLLFYLLIKIFVRKKSILLNLAFLAIIIYLLAIIKFYVVLSIIGASALLLVAYYHNQIKNKLIRVSILPMSIIIIAVITIISIKYLSILNQNYAFENLIETATTYQEENLSIVEQAGVGSSYTLGQYDGSILGAVLLVFKSINATLFRPYLWEAYSIVMLANAIESLFILLLTLQVLFKVKGIFERLGKPIAVFCFTFALLVAAGVGFSTFNFGSLARYKIPCIPFYLIGLYYIKYYRKSHISSYKTMRRRLVPARRIRRFHPPSVV